VRTGTVLAGYRFDSLISEGAMGAVYLAEHTTHELRVTVKAYKLPAAAFQSDGFGMATWTNRAAPIRRCKSRVRAAPPRAASEGWLQTPPARCAIVCAIVRNACRRQLPQELTYKSGVEQPRHPPTTGGCAGVSSSGAAQESNLPSLGLPDLTGLKTFSLVLETREAWSVVRRFAPFFGLAPMRAAVGAGISPTFEALLAESA
jgi:hypothetical protein